MSLDIDWSLLTSSDPSSLIALLNRQLVQTTRPSFIGPISVSSFSYGSQGPEVEIRDVRDVWRVFDEGDEEGDFDDESKKRDKEREEDLRGIDGEKYELVDYAHAPSLPNGHGEDGYGYGYPHYDHEYDHNPRARQQQQQRPRPVSMSSFASAPSLAVALARPAGPSTPTPNPNLNLAANPNPNLNALINGRRQSTTAASANGSVIGSGTGSGPFIPFHLPLDPYAYTFTSHLPSTPGLNPSLFSGGGASRAFARRAGSVLSLTHTHSQSLSIAPSAFGQHQQEQQRQRRITSAPHYPPQHQHQHQHQQHRRQHRQPTQPTHPQTAGTRQTQTSQFSPPPSPPAAPPGLAASQAQKPSSKPSPIPSLQLHLHLTHTSDLQITLLTSLQVNYPSKSFMALPLKLVITGFTLDAEVVMAFNGEKNRLHLTIVDEDGVGASGESLSVPTPTSTTTFNGGIPAGGGGGVGGGFKAPYAPGSGRTEDKPLPIGQRLLPNLQIESEIGHADAHVLRNVGKVERFIVDVVRKTLVEELVFPNFHTIAL